ncbi:hypothetical protein ACFL27_20170 [candidate division CSSED10-310 bacterium]|uniref:Uracil phosphoribosyltransferase n=1 Tax=candidate division CSSED10-310 bacterium TaxID=2855610 RepID=A0ABV6Z237_UNCC1
MTPNPILLDHPLLKIVLFPISSHSNHEKVLLRRDDYMKDGLLFPLKEVVDGKKQL